MFQSVVGSEGDENENSVNFLFDEKVMGMRAEADITSGQTGTNFLVYSQIEQIVIGGRGGAIGIDLGDVTVEEHSEEHDSGEETPEVDGALEGSDDNEEKSAKLRIVFELLWKDIV